MTAIKAPWHKPNFDLTVSLLKRETSSNILLKTVQKVAFAVAAAFTFIAELAINTVKLPIHLLAKAVTCLSKSSSTTEEDNISDSESEASEVGTRKLPADLKQAIEIAGTHVTESISAKIIQKAVRNHLERTQQLKTELETKARPVSMLERVSIWLESYAG